MSEENAGRLTGLREESLNQWEAGASVKHCGAAAPRRIKHTGPQINAGRRTDTHLSSLNRCDTNINFLDCKQKADARESIP